jgi:hypothetical protein
MSEVLTESESMLIVIYATSESSNTFFYEKENRVDISLTVQQRTQYFWIQSLPNLKK